MLARKTKSGKAAVGQDVLLARTSAIAATIFLLGAQRRDNDPLLIVSAAMAAAANPAAASLADVPMNDDQGAALRALLARAGTERMSMLAAAMRFGKTRVVAMMLDAAARDSRLPFTVRSAFAGDTHERRDCIEICAHRAAY